MQQARVQTAGLDGIDAYPVDLEVSSGGGVPGTVVVGLPDAALREARDRVQSAIAAGGYTYPGGRVTVNLAPARRRKEEGSAFDLPIALGILATLDPPPLEQGQLRQVAALGELSLDGRTRPVRGALAAAEALARVGVRRLLVSEQSAEAAALGARGRLEVIAVPTLQDAVKLLGRRPHRCHPVSVDPAALLAEAAAEDALDLADVRGAEAAKQALVLGAAGCHALLFSGPPGAGKTMLARRLPGLLPPLTTAQALELTRIRAGARFDEVRGEVLVRRRPFRAPHHTASHVALVGGGSPARPGEVSLAHEGVLFLDELPEFATRTLETLREPLEERRITITRARGAVTFPCDFLLVAAMNPCPCGYIGDLRKPCRCPPLAVERYAARVSGPLLDRIDLQVRLDPVSFDDLAAPPPPADDPWRTAAQRQRVAEARALQRERQGCLNGRLDGQELKRVAALTPEAGRILRRAAEGHLLTGRGVTRVQRVARTLADLEGRARIDSDDVALAVHLRVGEVGVGAR